MVFFVVRKYFSPVFPPCTDGISPKDLKRKNMYFPNLCESRRMLREGGWKLSGRNFAGCCRQKSGLKESRPGAGKRRTVCVVFPVKTGKSLDMEKGE